MIGEGGCCWALKVPAAGLLSHTPHDPLLAPSPPPCSVPSSPIALPTHTRHRLQLQHWPKRRRRGLSTRGRCHIRHTRPCHPPPTHFHPSCPFFISGTVHHGPGNAPSCSPVVAQPVSGFLTASATGMRL